ncbi:HET-domain-containing protein [Cenococcum geophilum]
MRLLRLEDTGEFSLVEIVGESIPPYAVLSHTWGAVYEEVTFKDIVDGTGKSKAGYTKIRFCGKQAAHDGLKFFWVDTCCIDKSSSAELSEAINSMFRWYHDAAECYVYLSDVSISGFASNDQSFQKSRWFSRGWTLQELLAPKSVKFFSMKGERLGDKHSLVQAIHEITGIPTQALQGHPLSQLSFDERMSWAQRRETKREEDAAYSLLGIFDIHMPLIYGEGRKKALVRLRKEFEESLKDELPGLPPAESIEAYKEFGIELRRAVAQFEGDKLKPNEWASGVRISDGKWKEIHDPRSQLRNDSEAHDESFADIPGLFREKSKNKNKAALLTSIRGGLGWASRQRGKLTNEVEMHHTLDNLALLTNIESHLLRQPTKLEDHMKDEQTQDPSRSMSIQRAFQRLLSDIQRETRLQLQNAVNDWLDVKKVDNRYNMSQYYDKQVSSRLEGTCEWIFSHPAYRTWILADSSDKAARLFWICAPAGRGKTILCASLVEHLKGMQSFPVASFFASPHAQSGGEPGSIIRSWIAQIAELDSDILELVRGHSEAGQRASESAIWSIFRSIVSHNRNYTFVLDGFDEYSRLDDVRTEFLQRLKKATKRTVSRILILSRDETDIKAELSPKMVHGAGHVML